MTDTKSVFTICSRCGQLCIDPIKVHLEGTGKSFSTASVCYACLSDAMERSGGRIEQFASGGLVLVSHQKVRKLDDQ